METFLKTEKEYIWFRNESGICHKDTLFNYGHETCTSTFMVPSKIILKKTIHDMLEAGKQDEKYYYEGSMHGKKLAEFVIRKDTLYQLRRSYVRENKSNVCPTLTANMGTGGNNVPIILDDYGIRKLTPIECLNFQGFPTWFKFPADVSMSQCYKQAGNSVVVPVIKRIAESIYKVL